jgi:hypothetical protein
MPLNDSMKTKLDDYKIIRGSDIHRDGMYLELQKDGKAIAEVFFSDSDQSMIINTFSNDIDYRVIQALLAEAERRLWPEREKDEKLEPKHLIGALSDPAVGEVHIHLDKDGIDYLIESLTKLRDKLEKNECDHDHFFSPEWAGSELSTINIKRGEKRVDHIKLYSWTPEWIEKNKIKA